jgi:O-acetyl-ADP-ribose deacetylase (regulator of RNase III)
MKEIKGDLIQLAKNGEFDVIVHGCNCFNTMGAGIAVKMRTEFKADTSPWEGSMFKGSIDKLGCISPLQCWIKDEIVLDDYNKDLFKDSKSLIVINAYTQYNYKSYKPLDYNALQLCLRKINYNYKGCKIGLPLIGCGLAGGIWDSNSDEINQLTEADMLHINSMGYCGLGVKQLIEKELKDCDVTIVFYNN